MAFLEDPRLRQRWNEISHNAEAATENAAAGLWAFQHNYINPCLASLWAAIEECLTPCLGDREERALRAAYRRRGRPENNFDFYDDWLADEYGPDFDSGVGARSGLLSGWGGEDWDRLLAGTGSTRDRGDHTEYRQPRRKRGMSYGTRGVRRKVSGEEDDPTVIPSTAPLGFLGRLPWKIGGTLRYKPSAADLQEHVGGPRMSRAGEHAPLLGSSDEEGEGTYQFQGRTRSGTTGSGDTSDSYRSRGDLFPSDGEGDEDAVPLDDDFAMPLEPSDDRGSYKTRSSKGKRPAHGRLSRTVSRTTIGSTNSKRSLGSRVSSGLAPPTPELEPPSMEELLNEEIRAQKEEDAAIERSRAAAIQLALARGLTPIEDSESLAEVKPQDEDPKVSTIPEPSAEEFGDFFVADSACNTRIGHEEQARSQPPAQTHVAQQLIPRVQSPTNGSAGKPSPEPDAGQGDDFIPARLPHFR